MSKGEYNYRHFAPDEYDFSDFDGLAAGAQFQDADVYTLDGEKVRLSDFLDKPLVLEMGSMTCPMYAQSAGPMQNHADRFPGLNFVVLYVREAHPGERIPAHRTAEEKIAAAKKTSKAHGEYRTVLVDQVSGEAHKAYGSMPNSIYIIDTDGTILFRSIWNNTNEIEAILDQISRRERVVSADMHPIPPFGFGGIKTLFMGGFVAFSDFLVGLPKLIGMHKEAGNM